MRKPGKDARGAWQFEPGDLVTRKVVHASVELGVVLRAQRGQAQVWYYTLLINGNVSYAETAFWLRPYKERRRQGKKRA